MIFFTSDLHFRHTNVLKYEPITRPFKTVEEMDEALIQNWNNVVAENDTVYVLGDLAMGELEYSIPLIKRLKGKIILIRGNHDNKRRVAAYQEIGIEVKDIEYIDYKGKFFILSHFPPVNEEFTKMVSENNKETIYLYGHVHSSAPKGFYKGTFHVGVDTNNLTPVSLEDLWQICKGD